MGSEAEFVGLKLPAEMYPKYLAIKSLEGDELHEAMKAVAKQLKEAGVQYPKPFHMLFRNCAGGGSMHEDVEERFSNGGRRKIWSEARRRLASTPPSWRTSQ